MEEEKRKEGEGEDKELERIMETRIQLMTNIREVKDDNKKRQEDKGERRGNVSERGNMETSTRPPLLPSSIPSFFFHMSKYKTTKIF